MSLYIVQVRSAQSGHVIGYLAKGKVVAKRPNATPYDSPSSAERAAHAHQTKTRSGKVAYAAWYYTVKPLKGKRT